MKDFFYYSMIRSKDENTTKTRKLDGTVPLDELPNLMRAMGYYPTNQEVRNMKDEVRFAHFAESGEYTNSVNLETFIRLFVNHRPVYGIGKNNIEGAFASLLSVIDHDKKEGTALPRDDLISMLRNYGENMTNPKEIAECLQMLVGDTNFKTAMPNEVTSDHFAENILGFEEVEEMEEDEDGMDREDEDMDDGMGGGYAAGYPVIPEEETMT